MKSAKGLRLIEEALEHLLTADTPQAIVTGENLLCFVEQKEYAGTMTQAMVMYTMARLLNKVESNPQREMELLEEACVIYDKHPPPTDNMRNWLMIYFEMGFMLCRCYFALKHYNRLDERVGRLLLFSGITSHVPGVMVANFWEFAAQAYEYVRAYRRAIDCAEMSVQILAHTRPTDRPTLLRLDAMQTNLNRLYEAAAKPHAMWAPHGSHSRLCETCSAVLDIENLLAGQPFDMCGECGNALFCNEKCAKRHNCRNAPKTLRRVNMRSRSKCALCFREKAPLCCARCRGPRYCDEQCQRSDWQLHRKDCK